MMRVSLQHFTSNVLRHRWYAVSLAFFGTLLGVCAARAMSEMPLMLGFLGMLAGIFLTLFGILIAGLVTLVNGAVEGAVVTLAATLPYLATVYFPGHVGPVDSSAIHLWTLLGVGVAVASNILTWVFAVILQRKTSWSVLIQSAALLGVLIVSILHLVYPGIADWWGTQLHALQAYYQQAATVTGAKMAMPAVASDAEAEVTDVVKQMVNGMIAMLILTNAMFQLALARWWQSIVYSPGSLGYELRNIRLSHLAGVLFIASLAISYLGNNVVLDVMPIVYVLFGTAGLSLVHYLFKRSESKHAFFWLMVFYVVLFMTLPFSLVMIAMLALFDIWLNVRRRIIKG